MSHLKKKSSGSGTARRKSGGVSPVLIIVLVIIVAAVGISALVGPTMGQCKEVISDFQTACNDMDASEMLDCLNPVIANPLRATLLVGTAVTGTDSSEILTKIFDTMGGGLDSLTSGSGMDMTQVMRGIEIKPYRFGLPGRKRTVRCKVTVAGFVSYMKITVGKSHGEPYIAGIKFDT